MSDELDSEIGDISNAIGRLNTALATLRLRHAELKEERLRRGQRERSVSDHAVVRYLERHEGLDIEAVREELRAIADASTPAKDGEHHWHEESQLILILGEAGQIITVLAPEQLEKWSNRKLRNGERVNLARPQITAGMSENGIG